MAAIQASVSSGGIELPEQWTALRALGCDLGQGFHFGRPMPPDEALAWIATNTRRSSGEPVA